MSYAFSRRVYWWSDCARSRFTTKRNQTIQRPDMKARTELRRAKLPPILEIDEDGIQVSEHEAWGHPRWSHAF